MQIGNVYRHFRETAEESALYLAVTEEHVLTFIWKRGRKQRLVALATEIGPLTSIPVSVRDLCARWGIPVARLDQEATELIGTPSAAGRTERPRSVGPLIYRLAKIRRSAS